MNEEGKTNMEQNLEEIMNLEEAAPIREALREEHGIDVTESGTIEYQDPLDQDVQYARKNIKKMIENSEGVMQTLSFIAKSSESPRTFEVLATLINTLVQANRELIDIQSKAAKTKQLGHKGNRSRNPEVHGDSPQTQYNTYYVGSTAEFQKAVQSGNVEVANT